MTAQAGGTLPLNVPGFLSPGNPVARATLDFLEQFAAYDPAAGGAGHGAQGPAPSVIADYFGHHRRRPVATIPGKDQARS